MFIIAVLMSFFDFSGVFFVVFIVFDFLVFFCLEKGVTLIW